MTKMRKVAMSLWLPVTILMLWQVLVSQGVLDALFFPAPTVLLSAGWEMMKSGDLEAQLGATLSRMLLGSAIGMFGGLLCGLLMGVFRPVQQSLEPMVSALNSTPKLALLPMLMLLTGIGETARIVPIVLTSFVVLAMHGLDAVHVVDRAYIELARNHGAGRRAMLRRVYLPASLPQIFTGIRLALGRALVLTIAVELVGSPNGLGNMIWMAWQTFSIDRLYIGVFTAATLGALLHNGLQAVEARLIPWGNRVGRA